MSAARHSWCARMQFTGRPSFVVGTVFTDGRDEREKARTLLVEAWRECMPPSMPEPDRIEVISGAVFFVERGE